MCSNSTFGPPQADWAPCVRIVVNAINRIGWDDAALIAQKAIDCLGISEPLSVETIDRVMEKENEESDEKLSQCDDQYYDNAGDLADSLLELITFNMDKINLCWYQA